MTPLLPCPFCGEPAEYDSQRWRPPTRPHFTSATGHAVTCSKCEAEVGLFECYEDAAEAWNRRFAARGDDWQPIETRPDTLRPCWIGRGSFMVAARPSSLTPGTWRTLWGDNLVQFQPTHWQKLPEPPSTPEPASLMLEEEARA